MTSVETSLTACDLILVAEMGVSAISGQSRLVKHDNFGQNKGGFY